MAGWKKIITSDPNSEDIAATGHADGKVLEAEGAGTAAKWVHKQIKSQVGTPTSAADFAETDANMIVDTDSGLIYHLSSDETKIYKHQYDGFTNLSGNVSGFTVLSDGSSLSSSYDLGSDADDWVNNVGFSASYNYLNGGTLTASASDNYIDCSGEASVDSTHFGPSSINIVTSDLTGSAPNQALTNFSNGVDIDLKYPADGTGWETDLGKKMTFTLFYADGVSDSSISKVIRFYNKTYVCTTTALNPAEATLMQAGNIVSSSRCKDNLSSSITDMYTNEQSTAVDIPLSSTGVYVWWGVPTRVLGSVNPSFKIGGFEAVFTKITSYTDFNNDVGATGFDEDFAWFRSPGAYDDGTVASTKLEILI
tara:strand:+ start:9280 stop:10377 length:1098 start_codon:yes stop_codon:yes gene_type:complete